MKKLILADSAGFCAGVDRSVKLAHKALEEFGSIICYGELIHNKDEVARLEAMGMTTVSDIEDIPEGARVLIRAHGISREEYSRLQAKGCAVIDGTCGKVMKVHRIAEQAQREGRKLLVMGDENHPEVRGIAGFCADSLVFSDEAALQKWLMEEPGRQNLPLSIVFQTTQTKKLYNFCENLIKKLCTNARVFDTICFATQTRQAEAIPT